MHVLNFLVRFLLFTTNTALFSHPTLPFPFFASLIPCLLIKVCSNWGSFSLPFANLCANFETITSLGKFGLLFLVTWYKCNWDNDIVLVFVTRYKYIWNNDSKVAWFLSFGTDTLCENSGQDCGRPRGSIVHTYTFGREDVLLRKYNNVSGFPTGQISGSVTVKEIAIRT